MQHLPALNTECEAEGIGSRRGTEDQTPLNRRQFLRHSALTVAGIGTISCLQGLQPPRALAQDANLVKNFLLFYGPFGPVLNINESGVGLVQHGYRFDYPLALYYNRRPEITTFRRGEALLLYGQDIPRPVFHDFPYPGPPFHDRYVHCFNYVQNLDPETVRVHHWCTFYAADEDEIRITSGGQLLASYVTRKRSGVPNQINNVNTKTELNPPNRWLFTTDPGPTGSSYWLIPNRQTPNPLTGTGETATWNTGFDNISNSRLLRVRAYIPGSAQPELRTANATYTIGYAGGEDVVSISQQQATSGLVRLGDPNGYPFRNGSFQIQLSNVTGEPHGSREVVAVGVSYGDL